LTDQRDQYDQREQPEPERERFEVTELEPPQNVTRIDSYKNKCDDEDGSPGAA
jgi:hypothetical protein